MIPTRQGSLKTKPLGEKMRSKQEGDNGDLMLAITLHSVEVIDEPTAASMWYTYS